MTSPPVVQAAGVTTALRGQRVLQDVTLEVRPGEIHALVGMNGAGKTTLMRILLGMLRADRGVASVFGTPVAGLSPGQWRQVGHLIETPAYYPELTVAENVTCAALLHGIPARDIPSSVGRVVADMALEKWVTERGKRLSLGTRQKLALACAMVHRPTALLLDEPSNGLDPSAVLRLRRLLTDVARCGGAVLLSSHHLDELARLADTVTVLHRGRVVGGLDPHGTDLERAFFDLVLAADQHLQGEPE